MKINKRILQFLRENGIYQSDLAERLKTNQPNLSRILNANDMKVSQLINISEKLGVSPAYFFDQFQPENEDYENLKREYKQLNDYHNLFHDHVRIIIESHFNLKMECFNSLFEKQNDKLKESLINQTKKECDEILEPFVDFNKMILDEIRAKFPTERNLVNRQCKAEIKKASRTPNEIELLKERAISIRESKNKK